MRYKIQVKEELSHDLKINVSAGTVRRALRSNGLGALPKVKKPDISDDNAKERLLWCKDRIDWTLDDWKCIIFTDELRVNCFNLDGLVWCWKRDNDEVQPKHTKKTRKHGGGRIMIRSEIS